jgi:hypothetical protein
MTAICVKRTILFAGREARFSRFGPDASAFFLLLIGSTHQRPVCEKTKRSGQPWQGEARIRKRMSYSELWPRRMMVTVVTSR